MVQGEETEVEGQDAPEMGVLGYCGVVSDKSSETPHLIEQRAKARLRDLSPALSPFEAERE